MGFCATKKGTATSPEKSGNWVEMGVLLAQEREQLAGRCCDVGMWEARPQLLMGVQDPTAEYQA